MATPTPKSIANILGQEPDSLVRRLISQQAEYHTLLAYLQTNLPRKQASHLVAVHCREDILVLLADSPAWANLIRYQNSKLLKLFQTEGKVFGDIDTATIKKIVVRTAATNLR